VFSTFSTFPDLNHTAYTLLPKTPTKHQPTQFRPTLYRFRHLPYTKRATLYRFRDLPYTQRPTLYQISIYPIPCLHCRVGYPIPYAYPIPGLTDLPYTAHRARELAVGRPLERTRWAEFTVGQPLKRTHWGKIPPLKKFSSQPRPLTTHQLLPTREFSVGPGRAGEPPSYTHRRAFGGAHARPGSWATFYFPQNSFVRENKKIDSRPPNSKTISHAFPLTGRRLQPSLPYTTIPTLYSFRNLPYTTYPIPPALSDPAL
jgi:hypothetical protein